MSRKRSWIKCICKQCNKEFEVVPYKIRKGGGKFCSRQCYQEWSKEANNRTRKGTNGQSSIIRTCEICGKEFKSKQSLLIKGRGRFCSRACQNIWQSKSKRGKNNPAWKGAHKFYVDGKLLYTNERGLVDRICQYCKNHFEIIPSEAKRGHGKFCSRTCMNNYQRNESHPGWRGGKEKRPSSLKKYASSYKSIIKKRPGYIYFLVADNGLHKIGRTKKFNKRIKRLSIKMPYELELIMIIQADDMCWLEYQLHQQFAEKRVRGEWFQLAKDDLEYAKNFSLSLLNPT